ncbi:MAG TPA: ion transporter [Blastocatellia bacterium]|jgi:voltage-gated potassium channel|nr:ion transporter [Blastocatellia bacterium]
MKKPDSKGPYAVFMLLLSFLALALLGVSSIFRVDHSSSEILQYADYAICCLFFGDFLISLFRAERKMKYFFTWGWLDLLSSIPMVDALRVTRAARILRLIRVLRGVRAAKILAEFILLRRTESAFLAVALISLLLVVSSSIAILQFEDSPEANIKTSEDALWWSVVTITTVGYGDRFPISSEGRLIAGLMMVAGVGLFGTLSGFIASWFLRPEREMEKSEIHSLTEEVRQLRQMLESQDKDRPA